MEENEKLDIVSTALSRAEVNFLVLPYFFLDKHRDNTKRAIEYRDVRTIGDEESEILWRVHPHPDFGIPRDFERRLHRAVEYIISLLPRPIRNPIPLGSYRNLARIMGVPCNGQFIKRVKAAILKMIMTGITTKKAYYNKHKRVWMEQAFHLYEKAVFIGQEMDDGTIADMNYLYLSEPYLQNINASYVCPIDYDLLRSLRPIAGRLYEILSVKFYGHPDFIQYRYSNLCKLLPVKCWRQLSQAKKQLNPAHEELVRRAFLRSYEWTPIPAVRNDWYIRYVPNRGYGEIIDVSSTEKLIPKNTPITAPEVEKLLAMLADGHRSKKTIRSAIEKAYDKYDFDRVARNIRYSNANCKKNYRAFLIKAIKNDWGLELQEDEEARKKMLREKETREREEERRREEMMRVRDYIENLSPEEFQALREKAISELGDSLKRKKSAASRILIRSQMEEIASQILRQNMEYHG